jgi:ribosomal protein L13E
MKRVNRMSVIPPPVPLVPRFVRGAHKLRKARGFSLGELKQAGLPKSQARSMKVRIDKRRSTIHAHNVTALTAFLGSPAEKAVLTDATVEVPSIVAEGKRSPEPHRRRAKRSAKLTQKRER